MVRRGRSSELAGVALALWAQAEGRRAIAELLKAGVRVLLLKGPELQMRLYGTPAAYPSGDIDILVPRDAGRRAMSLLRDHGWRFEPGNGVLWRLSRAATFEREGFRVDLHWGLHAAHLPASSLRRLEEALWRGATRGASGALEPTPETLLVFLAVHAAGHGFERPEWSTIVTVAARGVTDWNAVWALADRAKVTTAVRAALSDPSTSSGEPVLDGVFGRLQSRIAWIARGHFLPRGVRDRLREGVALGREGFGRSWLAPSRRARVGGLDLATPPGVFRPWDLSAELAHLALTQVPDAAGPIVVDVGTGAGVVALVVARARRDAVVIATDVSQRALRAAAKNASANGIRGVRFLRGSLLTPLPEAVRGRISLVVSNLPSVPPSAMSKIGPTADPRFTQEGPDLDGLGLYRALVREAPGWLAAQGRMVMMLRAWQYEALGDDLEAAGFALVGDVGSAVTTYRFYSVEMVPR